MSTIKIGDVVQLKSGGSLMTVEDVDHGAAFCVWFEGNVLHKQEFSLLLLEIVDLPS